MRPPCLERKNDREMVNTYLLPQDFDIRVFSHARVCVYKEDFSSWSSLSPKMYVGNKGRFKSVGVTRRVLAVNDWLLALKDGARWATCQDQPRNKWMWTINKKGYKNRMIGRKGWSTWNCASDCILTNATGWNLTPCKKTPKITGL